jgi:hypothetical protein
MIVLHIICMTFMMIFDVFLFFHIILHIYCTFIIVSSCLVKIIPSIFIIYHTLKQFNLQFYLFINFQQEFFQVYHQTFIFVKPIRR